MGGDGAVSERARVVLGRDIFRGMERAEPSDENIRLWLTAVYDNAVELERALGKRVRVSEPVIKLTVARWRRDGLPYCPCRPGVRKPEYICPCIDVLKILSGEAKRCRCGLYRVVE